MNFFNFINDQLLKMLWLRDGIDYFIKLIFPNLNNKWSNVLTFFCYDVIKISLLLCVLIFIISYLQSFITPDKTQKIIGRFKGISANLIGALFGTITPFCSCSSIPLFIGFTKAGLPLGVTFSFLISSPMVDLASVVLLASIFSWKIAIIYVISGLVIAIVGGWIIDHLNLTDQIADFILNDNKTANVNMINNRSYYAFNQMMTTLKKVFIYIIIGVGLGAFIHNFVPASLINNLLGNKNLFSVPIATLVGVPMYADIFGTIPIAQSLLLKGAGLGTVLSFMMAITTLSLPSMIMLSKVIKPKLLTIFIMIVVLGIIFTGYLFNFLMI